MGDVIHMPVLPDDVIVGRVINGDVQAYGTLVERYELAVFACCLGVLRDRHAAEDVTQDVFVLGYAKLRRLREPGRFGGWLLKVARREAVRTARRRKRSSVLPLGEMEPPDPGLQARLIDEDREYLLRQIQKLPLQEQLTVSLRYFEGCSVQQIGVMTGSPVGTVTKRLSRAIERLRAWLSPEER